MTELLYQLDAYLREFEGVVTAIDPETGGIFLDRTAFYPGGGGQQPDAGMLTAGDMHYVVTQAKKNGDAVLHLIEGASHPGIGTTLKGLLDWERRYAAMRTHTAMHILCGVIWHKFGVSVTGGNMELLKGRMDFEFGELTRDTIAEIETDINAEIAAARPIRVAILPRDEAFQIPDLIRTKINLLPPQIQQVRTVEIVGLDLQADGGTHVHNTSEVGHIRIADYQSKGKANKRLYIEVS
ncbi:MAG: alanyl-tRNA editing protein [Chloroflexi bacterium]|nr:alanyl-tRNA editing protein [Chloroflexota bacterium]